MRWEMRSEVVRWFDGWLPGKVLLRVWWVKLCPRGKPHVRVKV